MIIDLLTIFSVYNQGPVYQYQVGEEPYYDGSTHVNNIYQPVEQTYQYAPEPVYQVSQAPVYNREPDTTYQGSHRVYNRLPDQTYHSQTYQTYQGSPDQDFYPQANLNFEESQQTVQSLGPPTERLHLQEEAHPVSHEDYEPDASVSDLSTSAPGPSVTPDVILNADQEDLYEYHTKPPTT